MKHSSFSSFSPQEPPPPPARRTKSTGDVTSNPVTTTSLRHRHRRSLSAIPFSWEEHPGVAKEMNTKNSSSLNTFSSNRLPPPPPMSKKNLATASTSDPFEVALNECAKDPGTPPGLMEEIWGHTMVEKTKKSSSWRGIGAYSSCKAAWACSVVDATVPVSQNRAKNANFQFVNQRLYQID